jgi:cellulose synthase/poly-beta-1,6-N-acetylglucosamine synthase-like glycosyltransferase
MLWAFSGRLARGQDVIQADRLVLNADQSVLTRLYALAQRLRIEAFWAPKSDRGLSSIIFGSGFCLSRRITTRMGWSAFGVTEDWEYSLHLVRAGYRVIIARETWVSCEEPHSFRQGYRQRVRWARGRYAVMVRHGAGLLRAGIRRRDAALVDAGLTALTPNYSLLANLTLIGLGFAWWGHQYWGSWLPALFVSAIVGQAVYAAVGLVRLRPSRASLWALMAAPAYLCWIGVVSIRSAVWPRSVGWMQVRRS